MSLSKMLRENPVYEESIAREELHTYHPQTASYDYSDTIEITIAQDSAFIVFADSYLLIEGRFIVAAAGDGKPELTANAGAFMFSDMTYELNGKEIEKVRDPGILSTIRAYLCYSKNESEALHIAGWVVGGKPLYMSGEKFIMQIPLSFLFSVFQDFKNPILGKHVFRLTRATDDQNCYVTKPVDNKATKKASIKIDNISMKVLHIHPNAMEKLDVMKQLDLQVPFHIPFRKWQFYEKPTMSGTNEDLWPVKMTSPVERPRYVIVAFQTNIKHNFLKDASYFENLNITDIKLFLNSDAFPFEATRWDFASLKYTTLYQMYLNFQKSFLFKRNSEPLLDFQEFKEHALFVFDCSKHHDSVKPTHVDVKLEIHSSANFPANTRAYCILIHDCVYSYVPLLGTVKYMVE